ncbi:angiotensin-converting enzyme [Nephila pilipes]|uniref:Angiotensin-converting enzyme n=1 Tax=Nephila pilipes TaxID=299642 RepID=A0A8X6P9V4_NEPPI|nr:angiotensin-converting enzyme [Nephila pilipes]
MLFSGFKSKDEYYIHEYEDENFLKNIARVRKQLEPLYKQIHAYVRRKLIKIYLDDVSIASDGPIPVHLLGSITGQMWSSIYHLLIPYPKYEEYHVIRNKMREKHMEPIDMFLMAEEFFTSIGLKEMPARFWKYSVMEKPKDGRHMDCHSAAQDSFDGKNFRSIICALYK